MTEDVDQDRDFAAKVVLRVIDLLGLIPML